MILEIGCSYSLNAPKKGLEVSLFNIDAISAIPVVAILSAVPWLLPWGEINVPYLPTFHVVSSVSPWIGSTLYHLFMNHNTGYMAYKVLLTIDMLGIWVTQTAGKYHH